MIQFATPEWVSAFKQSINTSVAYREAAKNWEGDIWFVVEPEEDDPNGKPAYMYLDLWHGECRDAFFAEDDSTKSAEFRIWAPAKNWKKVVTKQTDPIKALMTGTLKLKGNLAKIMRSVKAAQELVLCASCVPTSFE
jgi:putative sterol carrier protein